MILQIKTLIVTAAIDSWELLRPAKNTGTMMNAVAQPEMFHELTAEYISKIEIDRIINIVE